VNFVQSIGELPQTHDNQDNDYHNRNPFMVFAPVNELVYFCDFFVQVSFKLIVRLKSSLPSVPALSSAKFIRLLPGAK
jgi:hypothetical protein